MIYWTWTFPWNNAESLLGILLANNVEVMDETGAYEVSLISLGFILGRVDIMFNKEEIKLED